MENDLLSRNVSQFFHLEEIDDEIWSGLFLHFEDVGYFWRVKQRSTRFVEVG